MEGVLDIIIRKMTGHTSQIMERYKHLDASLSALSCSDVICGRQSRKLPQQAGTIGSAMMIYVKH
jgi:hypothetical protein